MPGLQVWVAEGRGGSSGWVLLGSQSLGPRWSVDLAVPAVQVREAPWGGSPGGGGQRQEGCAGTQATVAGVSRGACGGGMLEQETRGGLSTGLNRRPAGQSCREVGWDGAAKQRSATTQAARRVRPPPGLPAAPCWPCRETLVPQGTRPWPWSGCHCGAAPGRGSA